MDKLKKLLGEELFEQVTEKLGETKLMIDDGNFIPKARFDQVNGEKNEFKEQLSDRDNQLTELKKQVKDNQELTEKITELQEQNKKTAEDYEQKLTEQRFDFALDKALAKAGAKSTKAVKALLDLEKVKLDGENLIGLEDQVKMVQEEHDYLFGGTELKGRTPNKTGETPPPADNPWKKESLNLTKQGQILREDPELAERLQKAAGK